MDTFRCLKVQDSVSSSTRMSSTTIRSSGSFSTSSQKTGIVARLCNPLHPWISKRLTSIVLEKINTPSQESPAFTPGEEWRVLSRIGLDWTVHRYYTRSEE